VYVIRAKVPKVAAYTLIREADTAHKAPDDFLRTAITEHLHDALEAPAPADLSSSELMILRVTVSDALAMSLERTAKTKDISVPEAVARVIIHLHELSSAMTPAGV
jgi:hypothetical protein